jgi:5-methylcytosine-specific restriction endonuclease McrA
MKINKAIVFSLSIFFLLSIVGFSTPVSSQNERINRINEYFRHANENVGAFECNIRVNQRGVDESTKKAVKRINSNQCVICGSTYKLEVDHMRALQNGGTNDLSNLATLCDDCHLIKTKYDNSLRRKRNNVCRKK